MQLHWRGLFVGTLCREKMDTETVNAIKVLFEEYAKKDSGVVTAALLTVGGMLGVAILGAITQWLITKRILNEETKRISIRLNSEFQVQRHQKWESEILDSLVQLLKVTEPDVIGGINNSEVAEKIIRFQLLLDNSKPLQGQINNIANHLALAVTGQQGPIDKCTVLKLHGHLQDLAKNLIYHPNH